MDLDRAYRLCREITHRAARNFYYAFLSLPRRQRLSVYALYAFCRAADDVVDSSERFCSSESSAFGGLAEAAKLAGAGFRAGETKSAIALGSRSAAVQPRGLASSIQVELESKRAGLTRLRERLRWAADGRPEPGIDLALADTIERFGVDPGDLADVLSGMEMDLGLRRLETFGELRDYCYRAASAVGLATLPILNGGVPPTDGMREAAVDLGLGMQFVNILRDVAEDLDRERIYLPSEEMDAFGVTGEALAARSMTDDLRGLLAHQADRADEFLRRGLRLLPQLPRSGRRCPWLLAEFYGRILRRIRQAGYDVFRERIGLSKTEKVWLLLASRWKRL